MSAARSRHSADELPPVGRLVLKGKAAALDCVTFARTVPAAAVRTYREAYALLELDAEAGAKLFVDLCREWPEHGLFKLHLRRLERGEVGTTIVLEGK